MKITNVQARILKPLTAEQIWRVGFPPNKLEPILFQVETDEGITGDFITVFCPASQTDHIPAVRKAITGMDPHDVGLIGGIVRGALAIEFVMSPNGVSSAIDICLWDLLAKKAELPLYKYLGASRSKMRAYASIVKHQIQGKPYYDRDQAYVEEALRCRNEGFTAFKLHAYDIPESDIRVCRAVREAVGPSMDLMLDPVCMYSRKDAFRVGRALEELKYYWYEDPIPGTDIEGLVDLSRALDIPVAVGETMFSGLEYYAPYLIRHAGDIIRIIGDIAGGISAMSKLAHMCEGFYVNCEPHSYGTVLSQAACLHVMLSIKNCDFFELPVPVGFFDFGMKDKIRIAKDGYVYAPTKPGLGYELDWDEIENATTKKIR